SVYMKFREKKRLTHQREYEKQQKMVDRIEAQMNGLASWSENAHAQSTKKEGFKEYHRVKAKRTEDHIKSKQKRLEKE
ncbi:ABC transporter ATP-binding protein, partial [Bacillus subtilis]|nr:ABC transporter ATP-binding protein [Bacillus subtilis]